MNVKIKRFDAAVDVKNKGIEFEIRTPNSESQLGDCYMTKAGLIWCSGRKKKRNGIKVKWEDFITLMSSREGLKRALKAAKNPPEN